MWQKFITKCVRLLLQCASGITKCDRLSHKWICSIPSITSHIVAKTEALAISFFPFLFLFSSPYHSFSYWSYHWEKIIAGDWVKNKFWVISPLHVHKRFQHLLWLSFPFKNITMLRQIDFFVYEKTTNVLILKEMIKNPYYCFCTKKSVVFYSWLQGCWGRWKGGWRSLKGME